MWERGTRYCRSGVQHEERPAAVFLFGAVGAKHGGRTRTVPAEVSLGHGDVAVIVSRDGGDVNRWGESTQLGDGQVALLHPDSLRALIGSDEKKKVVGSHGTYRRTAAGERQDDRLDQGNRNRVEVCRYRVGFFINVKEDVTRVTGVHDVNGAGDNVPHH